MAVGCGDDPNNVAQQLSDPTGEVPDHVIWTSYNLYRYEPGAQGSFVKIINQGQLPTQQPTLGANPAMFVHGFGGSIANQRFVSMAQNLIDNNLATSVFGFEYDSQDGIASSGLKFSQAFTVLNPPSIPRTTWKIVAHSMGGLVARSAHQNTVLPIAFASNRIITLGTPQFGSPVANAVQTTQDVPTRTAVISNLNQGGFTNIDGNPSRVDLNCQGLTDLRLNSAFLANLNNSIGNHPQFNYFSIAGNQKGSNLASMNQQLGVVTDDGFVTIPSANPPEIGALGSAVVPTEHTNLTQDAVNVFPLVRAFLTQ